MALIYGFNMLQTYSTNWAWTLKSQYWHKKWHKNSWLNGRLIFNKFLKSFAILINCNVNFSKSKVKNKPFIVLTFEYYDHHVTKFRMNSSLSYCVSAFTHTCTHTRTHARTHQNYALFFAEQMAWGWQWRCKYEVQHIYWQDFVPAKDSSPDLKRRNEPDI